jgi:hypothetical protein
MRREVFEGFPQQAARSLAERLSTIRDHVGAAEVFAQRSPESFLSDTFRACFVQASAETIAAIDSIARNGPHQDASKALHDALIWGNDLIYGIGAMSRRQRHFTRRLQAGLDRATEYGAVKCSWSGHGDVLISVSTNEITTHSLTSIIQQSANNESEHYGVEFASWEDGREARGLAVDTEQQAPAGLMFELGLEPRVTRKWAWDESVPGNLSPYRLMICDLSSIRAIYARRSLEDEFTHPIIKAEPIDFKIMRVLFDARGKPLSSAEINSLADTPKTRVSDRVGTWNRLARQWFDQDLVLVGRGEKMTFRLNERFVRTAFLSNVR